MFVSKMGSADKRCPFFRVELVIVMFSFLAPILLALSLVIPMPMQGQIAAPSTAQSARPLDAPLSEVQSLIQRGKWAQAESSLRAYLASRANSTDGHAMLAFV